MHGKQCSNPFPHPYPYVSMAALKISMSVCFCVSVGQRCESMPNSEGHIASPKDKALLYSLRRFYFLFFQRSRKATGATPSYLETCAVLGLIEGPFGYEPEQKFQVPRTLCGDLAGSAVPSCIRVVAVLLFLQVFSDWDTSCESRFPRDASHS